MNLIVQQQAPAAAKAPSVSGPPRPSQNEYNVLKAREKELNNQLSEVKDRRDDLARERDQVSGTERASIDSRIGLLDQRLTQIETDLSSVGRDLVATAPTSTVEPPIIVRYRGYDDGDMVGAGFTGVALTVALFLPFLIRSFRRKRQPQNSQSTPAIGGERIERMEHAIDTIAVEIERVSENQRFMTRLLTETQLAGTIAAVRGSTEAAKVAAERGLDAG